MASRNSILLILKQRSGLSYNELLARVLGDYSNTNSARAALSRTLKNAESLGLLRRKENRFFLTDKGAATLFMEMKNKLILSIAESLAEKNASKTVEQLSTLIERSKADSELLRIAKESAGFYIADLESFRIETEKKIRQLNYLNSMLEKHLKTLSDLGFRDRVFFKREELSGILGFLLKKENLKEIVLTADPETLKKASGFFELPVHSNAIVAKTGDADKIAVFFNKNELNATLAFADFVLRIGKWVEVIAPAKKLGLMPKKFN